MSLQSLTNKHAILQTGLHNIIYKLFGVNKSSYKKDNRSYYELLKCNNETLGENMDKNTGIQNI